MNSAETGTGRTILKNAGVLMVSQLATWGLSLLLTLFLPRYLGVTSIGKLHLAESLWSIVSVVVAFGMDTLLIKEIARRPERVGDLLGTTMVVRTFFHLIGFFGLVLYARAFDYPSETLTIIYIIGISSLLGQYGGSVTAALQGLERMDFQSIANVLSRAIGTVISIILLLMGYKLIVIVSVFVLISLVNFLTQFLLLRRVQDFKLRFTWGQGKEMLKYSLPLFGVGFFIIVYSQLDIVIISHLVNEDGVGWYGVADRFFGTLLFVPTVFLTAVFPALSRMFSSSPNSLPRLMGKSFDLLFVLSVPIGLGLIAISSPLVIGLFGEEFANTAPILAVRGIVLIFTYQNILLGQFLISIDRQNSWSFVLAAATLATIPLDFLLIPWCETAFSNGAIGGALAYIVTEVGMFIIALRLLPKGWLNKNNTKFAVKTVIAGLVMLFAVWWVKDLFILIPILVGVMTYLGMILVLRIIPKEDWLLIRELGQAVTKRVQKPQPKLSKTG
ncbi:MAG: flippase [Anaerolineaceae bacterium]|nr:flippase [Anaerolineaceae bacterium]